MNFRQLETFYWIAQLGQFGAAAARLNATQSTISTRIQELETSLGATVFDRSGRTVQLTDVGRALLPYAEEALSLARRIQENIVGHTPVAGLVRIGVGEIVALSWFPQMLSALSARHPALEVEVVVDLSVNLIRMLRAGQLDMGFVVGPVEAHDISCLPLGSARMHWYASAALGLGGRFVDFAELDAIPILTLSRESHMHRHVSEWLLGHGQGPRRRRLFGCNSLTTLAALARSGIGVAVLPDILVTREVKGGELEILKLPLPIDRYDFLIVSPYGRSDPAVRAISEISIALSREIGGCSSSGWSYRERDAAGATP
ncbi:LysR family transcriptional regulator [Xanthobacter pseudotagetidis]|uniref:LysR family transcriptional regulator n=1 Tax=Xanthobacter pseudotagetidis TaxID=3119911 RepID=UPI00372A6BA3